MTADLDKDSTRCISFTSVYRAIARTKHFVVKESKGAVLQYGPLWGGDNDKTLRRLGRVVNGWLGPIAETAAEWWSLGSGEGGGLAMNDGVVACMLVFDSVLEHLDKQGTGLVQKDDEDLCDLLRPYATQVGAYLTSLSEDKRKSFRDLRGVQGQTVRARQMQLALREKYPSYDPPGLDQFFKEQSAETNIKAKRAIDRIEQTVQAIVVQELKQNFRGVDDAWWVEGIPRAIRVDVTRRAENDDNKRGSREAYLDFIDYREIAHKNWTIFQSVLGYGKKNEKKERQTHWMVEVNEWRNIVAHASSGRSVPIDDLGRLLGYESWVRGRLDGSEAPANYEAEEQVSDDAAS